MCGITGSFESGRPLSLRRLREATDMINYRGPDDYGYLLLSPDDRITELKRNDSLNGLNDIAFNGGLGFRRLSILDLSEQGHQPMRDESGKYAIVFNGEIYNYIEIREELKSKGYVFRSDCDTEVILYSYIEWGTECVSRFEGMWSFCILDRNERILFCSVDRFGIKPFYYHFGAKEFHFGSEIKQVLHLIGGRSEINRKVLFDYLAAESYGNETEETFFTGIFKLQPGQNIIVDRGKTEFVLRREKYWDLKVNRAVSELTDEKYIKEKIRELFFESVKMHLRSDVEVGTCLSGGIDSSSIVCAVNRVNDNGGSRQKHFTILSGEGKLNEYEYASEVSKSVNGEHITKTVSSSELRQEIENLIWHNDEPLLKASMYGGYSAYKLASEYGLKVILDGQGHDEYSGGYFTAPYPELLSTLRKNGKKDILRTQKKFLKENEKFSTYGILLSECRFSLRKELHKMFERRFRMKLKKTAGEWFDVDFVNENILKSQLYEKHDMEDEFLNKDDFRRKSYRLTRRINLPGILRQVDRNSMAFSVEARVPFLDHRLAEFLYSLPAWQIIRGNVTKFMFRESMKGIVPDRILSRTDKIGFYIDEYSLMLESREFVKEKFEELEDKDGIFNRKYLLDNTDKILEDRKSYDSKLWRSLNSVIWKNKFNIK
ncbi:MAG: asparagine synthase (glutamine-hydrolyzing) [Ignavibacteria bacterium]